MASYELTILLNDDSELKTIKELIESLSGKIKKEDKWGEKTLAYPIKKQRTAHFFNWSFDMDKSKVTEFRKKLNFNDKILRFLLILK